MKNNQIHDLNVICILMLIEKFGLAVEYYLNKMVELYICICNVKKLKIKFEKVLVENNKGFLGKIIGRYFI